MSARRTLRRLLPVLLLALLSALVARQRGAKRVAAAPRQPLLLTPVEVAVEATTEEIGLDELLAEAAEPAPVEAALIAAEAVPEQQIDVHAAPGPDAAVHMITVVDDLLTGRSAEESATIPR